MSIVFLPPDCMYFKIKTEINHVSKTDNMEKELSRSEVQNVHLIIVHNYSRLEHRCMRIEILRYNKRILKFHGLRNKVEHQWRKIRLLGPNIDYFVIFHNQTSTMNSVNCRFTKRNTISELLIDLVTRRRKGVASKSEGDRDLHIPILNKT